MSAQLSKILTTVFPTALKRAPIKNSCYHLRIWHKKLENIHKSGGNKRNMQIAEHIKLGNEIPQRWRAHWSKSPTITAQQHMRRRHCTSMHITHMSSAVFTNHVQTGHGSVTYLPFLVISTVHYMQLYLVSKREWK